MGANNLCNLLKAKQFVVEVEIDGYSDTQFWVHESYEKYKQYYGENDRAIREPIINSIQHAKIMTLEEAIILEYESEWPTTIYMVDEDGEDPLLIGALDNYTAVLINDRLDKVMRGRV